MGSGLAAGSSSGVPAGPRGRHGRMERVMGIEPTSSAWEAEVLPLNYTRGGVDCTRVPPPRATVRGPRCRDLVAFACCPICVSRRVYSRLEGTGPLICLRAQRNELPGPNHT